MFIIGGIQKTSLIDFPGKIAAVVFTQGCNFRCGYCHNPSLAVSSPHWENRLSHKDILSFLQTRIGKLDGIVISGGEPTIQSGLYDFIKEIKNMGFLVKLDTNGTNPQVLERLINDNLLDYIAMDIKAPLEKYPQIINIASLSEGLAPRHTPLPVGEGVIVSELCEHYNDGRGFDNKIMNNIIKSIVLIKNSKLDYEFRTTVLKSQLLPYDFEKIGQMIKGAKRYYLQKFVPANILDKNLIKEQTYTDTEFKTICHNLKKYVEFVDYR